MFAIALFDKEDNSLYLIRDYIGKKPLYYYIDSGNLYYASELKPLMDNPYFEKRINDKSWESSCTGSTSMLPILSINQHIN